MNSEFLIAAFLSAVLGGLIGWQRHHIGKSVGMRTYALVSLASTLFTILSLYGFSGDNSRIAANILAGIGFIGAGIIFHKKTTIEGITSAAGFWAVGAIGMLVGVSWYAEAIIATLFMFGILSLPNGKK